MRLRVIVPILVTAGLLTACAAPARRGASHVPTIERVSGGPTGTYLVPPGIHKIKHVIIIVQENRSFDSYFGTFPGSDGIPMQDGAPSVCISNPLGGCGTPYHDSADRNGGGPHGAAAAAADVDHGKMDGFIGQVLAAKSSCKTPTDPACEVLPGQPVDVMGYHTSAEIPNYWAYAEDYVLDDHMFESVSSWSLPDHLYLVSGWSAKCKNTSPSTCVNSIVGPYSPLQFDNAVDQELATGTTSIDLAWTDITWLLFQFHVSWAYYVQTGTQPDCENDSAETCPPVEQKYRTPGIWNPLPLFTDVQTDHQVSNVKPLDAFFTAANDGSLPSVSWITPSNVDSEHPPASVHQGQAYVTAIINAAMKSPDWDSTAVFLSWDDWGGFYDDMVPPTVDGSGYGLRVPSIVISPYAKSHFVDHQVLSGDAYLKFIEDDLLVGQRLDPKTDRRWDPRPDVRETKPELGNLVDDFDFSQSPRPPTLFPTNPPSDSPTLPPFFLTAPACVGCTTLPPDRGSLVETRVP